LFHEIIFPFCVRVLVLSFELFLSRISPKVFFMLSANAFFLLSIGKFYSLVFSLSLNLWFSGLVFIFILPCFCMCTWVWQIYVSTSFFSNSFSRIFSLLCSLSFYVLFCITTITSSNVRKKFSQVSDISKKNAVDLKTFHLAFTFWRCNWLEEKFKIVVLCISKVIKKFSYIHHYGRK
jgi:hypothetical protein